MKNTIKTLFFSLLIAGTATAQGLVEQSSTTTVEKYEINDKRTITVKTTNREYQKIVLESDDKGQLNQDRAKSPILVEKTILIDNDNDNIYDKELQITYVKEEGEKIKLNYATTANGIVVPTASNKIRFLSDEGNYNIESPDGEDIIIEVDNLNSERK